MSKELVLDYEKDYRFLKNHFMHRNGIQVVEITKEYVIMKTDIIEDYLNPNGYVHGGLLFTLADCVAGTTARMDGRNYVTQTANTNFLSNVNSGTVYARSEIVSRKNRISVIHVEVYQDDTLLMDSTFNMYCVGTT